MSQEECCTHREGALGQAHPGARFAREERARLLANDPATVSLVIGSIGSDNTHALLRALESNTTVRTLITMDAHLGNAGAAILARVLSKHPALLSVSLSEPRLRDDAVRTLAHALASSCCNLTELNLLCVPVGDYGASMLAQALGTNSALRVLSIRRGNVGAVGTRALADQLVLRNKTLQSLDLSNNELGNDGVLAFVKAFWAPGETPLTMGLTELRLAENDIRPLGMAILATFLAQELTGPLCVLDVSGNSFGPTGGEALAAAVEARILLRQVILHNTGLSDALVHRFAQLQTRHEAFYHYSFRIMALRCAALRGQQHQVDPRSASTACPRLPPELWDLLVMEKYLLL